MPSYSLSGPSFALVPFTRKSRGVRPGPDAGALRRPDSLNEPSSPDRPTIPATHTP